jgi:ribosomal protein S18 acetylase RimI-like enzyme
VTVLVRPAHTRELALVGELTARAYTADGVVDPSDDYLDHLRDAVTRAREAELYVAVLPDPDDPCDRGGTGGLDATGQTDQAERPAGTVTFCPEGSPWCELARPGEGEFRMLAVDPLARRRGVAAALVGTCVERARELGYDALVLSSLPAQTPAHALYGRLGFRRTPHRDWSPAPGVDLLAFRMDLR